MSKPLENQVAIVTGGGAYMGEAVALKLGAAGAAVVVAHPTIEEANGVVAAIEAAGGKAIAVLTDTTSRESVDAMVAKAAEWGGRIDIFHQGQYTIGTLKPVVDLSDKEWHDAINMDLHGVFYLCRAIAPHMIKQKSGAMILTSSGRGTHGWKEFSAYGSAMAGVVGLMKTLQWELGEHGISINSFVPGFVVAPRTIKQMGMEKIETLRQAAPHKQLPTCENIASFIYYLVTEGRWITGQLHNLSTYTE